jgi:soluble lytic murein transglycosylase-like protein
MKLLLLLLIPSITFANDLFKPLFPESKNNCSTAEIVRILPDSYKERIETVNTVVNKISNDLNVDACLILSMVWAESTFKPSQRSFKGANGLLQVMPTTHKETRLKMKYKLNTMLTSTLNYNLEYVEIENLIIGTYYYSKLLKKFKGDRNKAVIAYNMGASYVLNNGVSSNHNYLKKVTQKFNLIAVSN